MNQSMAAKLSTCLWTHRLAGLHHHRRRSSVAGLRLPPSPRLLPASCKMRNRNPSSQYKSQGMKKAPPELLPSDADFQPNGDEDIVPILNQETISNAGENSVLVENTNVNDTGRPHKLDKTKSMKKRQQFGKASTEPLPTDADFNAKRDEESVSENTSTDSVPGLNSESVSDNDTENGILVEHIDVNDAVTVSLPSKTKLQVIKKDGGEQLSNIQLEDLIGLIRNAEKNILLLNQARVDALEDLGKILTEKEMLQAEINTLEMRVAETDARIKVAAQDKIHVELLENQLEKLLDELNYKGVPERSELDMHTKQEKVLNGKVSQSHESSLHSLSKELSALRLENKSLNNDIQTLKAELNGIKNIDLKNDVEVLKAEFNNVKNTDGRVVALEKERLVLEASLKNLESKLSVSQEDISKLSTLKSECKHLWEKVESLQSLLDKATKQADQAIFVLQQNQELRKKVDQLEETLNEAKVYKLSSDKMQQYNELMVQKIRTLEEHLQKSDEDIYSYVQLYQESVKEFQDTLDVLKEESKKRALDEPADDMPREFWSRVLLVIDGWLLEKKISTDDAKLLREMVWKRNGRIHEAYKNCKGKNEKEALSIFLRLISSTTSPGLHVIHIAAEMAPVAKVGGLGDVVTGLSKALQKRGHLLEIILPKYDCMEYDHIRDLRVLDMELESYFGGQLFKNKIWVGTVEGLPVYFIEPLHPDKFFWRGQVYGERDDFKRFSYFSRAALELILQSGKKPDIIHCHDWQTAFVAPLYWDLYAPKGLNSARICFTCHNFEYQGTAPASELASCGLDVNQLNRPDRMQDNSFHDRINPIKGAIVFSNIVTTVSPTYGQEVRTAEGGRGLHSTLNFHSKKFYGILNGIDTDTWNPAADAFLKVQYSANDLEGKSENKSALRAHLGLSAADAKRPLVGCITRLVPQKGVHLIRHAMFRTLELGGQFVLLGSSPVPQIQREFESIAHQFQDHEHIRLILKYDESFSHSIYAASDMFIIPSLFEPCGLTQLIAMRYGAVPIARKTGGLSDSVFDLDDNAIPSQFRNGFTFTTPDEQGLNNALERAFKHYRNDEKWEQIVQKVMNIDFSWDSSAVQYEDLYLKSVARARATRAT